MMKTRNLFGMLLGCLVAFGFISCSDDNGDIDSQLQGMWNVEEPVLEDDFVTSYTFDTGKHTCSIYTGSPSSNGVPIICTYKISEDGNHITFVNEERQYTEQYQILKQTSNEMKWKNATPADGNTDKQLEKVRE